MNRERLVRALAPIAPPCFESRSQWLEYLGAAAIEQKSEHMPGPLLFVKGELVRFDPGFSFCSDCTVEYGTAMRKARRCEPLFVLEQLGGTVPSDVAA